MMLCTGMMSGVPAITPTSPKIGINVSPSFPNCSSDLSAGPKHE